MMASDVSVPAAVVPAAVVPAAVNIKPHFALFYDYVPDVLERRQPHRQAHLALVKDFKERGKFVMGGAMADPVDSALIVFTDRHSAESFALEDPYVSCAAVASAVGDSHQLAVTDRYVQNGIVTRHRVREWSTVVL